MLIEASDRPFTYRWPKGEICFVRGRPVDVSALVGWVALRYCIAKINIEL